MTLKSKFKEAPGFQFVADSLELMSSAGKRRLLTQPWLNDAQALNREYDRIEEAILFLNDADATASINGVRHQLMQMHDIAGTLQSLHSHILLNEIELFEIKLFAKLYATAYRFLGEHNRQSLLATSEADLCAIADQAFSILDPDNTGMAHFYIYDSYDTRLAPLRKELKACNNEDADLFSQQEAIEREVILRLSDQLHPLALSLSEALNQMAELDLLLAKATLAKQWNLCRPQLCEAREGLSFLELSNPRLRHHNETLGLRYQPVDIDLYQGVCFITGANMAGKTVLLKTIGVAQLMAQFGMFVPARKARINLVDDVVLCIGDEQNEMKGLSSFASEIIKISNTLQRAHNEHLLVLIDEPARTTNPIEGKAIVQSLATILESKSSFSLITTHYSQLALPCRRLRVKGFVESMSSEPLTPQNINLFMDYSLLPDTTDDVPQEALRIASILDCDKEMLDTARNFL